MGVAWTHTVKWTGSTSGTMPDPVSVRPKWKVAENVFRTQDGERRRSRKGLWPAVEIRWVLAPAEVATLESLLAAENADSDAVPFTLSLDGTAYARAHLAKEPEIRNVRDTNVGLEVTLEFEYCDRAAGFASPIHRGDPA